MTTNIVKSGAKVFLVKSDADYAAKLTLDRWEAGTERGIKFAQRSEAFTYEAGLHYSFGAQIYCLEGAVDQPGVTVVITITFSDSTVVTQTFTNQGVKITKNAEGLIMSAEAEWTTPSLLAVVPLTATYADCELYVYQDCISEMHGVIVDSFTANLKNTIAYQDTYLQIDREIIKTDGLIVSEGYSGFMLPSDARGQHGTLKARHKHKAEGYIIKVLGGQSKDAGHPLNILLRLLMTTGSGINDYDPASHKYDAGDGFGRALRTRVCDPRVTNDDRDNIVVDVAAIEALRDETMLGYDAFRAEFRFKGQVDDFKNWAEEELMRPFGYRWALGTEGRISVARISPLFLDQERAGVMASGVFTPTVDPHWYTNLWYRTPAVFLWVKELNQTFTITACSVTAITISSPPPDGNYTCAILPKAKSDTYPYCATIEERDFEGIPMLSYNTDIVNQITWKIDHDAGDTVDTRTNTKYLTTEVYDESSFWGIDFRDGNASSKHFYEVKNMDIKASGMRGAGASRFANGYNLNANNVCRKVTFDLIRIWRSQLPNVNGAVSLKHVGVDVGDFVRVKHSKVWDWKTGVMGIDKICQLEKFQHDLMKKKVDINGRSVSDLDCPPLLPPFTFPTLYQNFCSVKHPPIEVFKSLKIHDYPFFIGNIYFLRQNFTAIDANDAKTRTWNKHRTLGLWTPQDEIDYQNNIGNVTPNWWRHTNVYISSDGINFVKIAETRETYIFFAWEADDQSDTNDSLYIKFSYSSFSYDPVTGGYQESALCPSNPSEQTAIDKYPNGKAGMDMGWRRDDWAQLRAMERRAKMRRYSKLGGTME